MMPGVASKLLSGPRRIAGSLLSGVLFFYHPISYRQHDTVLESSEESGADQSASGFSLQVSRGPNVELVVWVGLG
jgi:hypothetical protein